jgi:hypothetical protein
MKFYPAIWFYYFDFEYAGTPLAVAIAWWVTYINLVMSFVWYVLLIAHLKYQVCEKNRYLFICAAFNNVGSGK